LRRADRDEPGIEAAMDVQSPSDVVVPPLMRAGGELSPAAVAALCGHPDFPQAMRAVLADNVHLYRGNRILNYVGHDRGRLIIAILAFYLHASRRSGDPTSGLTAHGLKSLCVEQDVCSPGRARAMLSLLRLFGYVAPAPAGDRRFKLLVPTELLITSLRQRWSAMFAAIALLKPECAEARAALDRPEFLAALVRRMVDEYRAGARALQSTPELRPFAERNAGLMILASLVLAAEPDDTMPPTRPVRISISELARRFSVSRPHVTRLLRDAAAAGLIERAGTPQEAITLLLPPLSLALRHSVAFVFLFFAHCARAALAEIDGEDGSMSC
jgi:DNA-binding transcriptional ArsR family regulator